MVLMRRAPKAGGTYTSSVYPYRSGRKIIVNGAPWRGVGYNVFNLANDPAVYQVGGTRNNFTTPATGLDDIFTRTKNEASGTVVRFWAFQSYVTNASNVRDWTAMDRVFARAKAAGVFLIPVLENQQATLTRGTYRDDAWYSTGYKSPYGTTAYPVSYQQYVTDFATRYKNETSILYYSMMNEAETATTATLVAWATDIAARLKAADPNHMVAIGVQGKDENGNRNTDYQTLHALANVDIATIHRYRSHEVPNTGLLPVSGWYARGLSIQGANPLNYGNYYNYERYPLSSKQWTPIRGVLAGTPGAVGLYLHGDPTATGDIYIGKMQIGSDHTPYQTINFEDGTIKSAQQDGSGTLSNSATYALPGLTKSLKLTASTNMDGNVVVPINAGAAGKEFTVWVLADPALALTAPGSGDGGRFMQAKNIDKPVVVEEIGVELNTNNDLVPIITSKLARAQVYEPMVNGYFGLGASAVLLWSYENADRQPEDWCITTGDPTNDVLKRVAAGL